MTVQSKYQPFLTLDYITNEFENKLFDRKSSRIKASDLASIISAFANAEGGTIVIGIGSSWIQLIARYWLLWQATLK